MTQNDKHKLENVRLWINNHDETDVVIDILKHHKQNIYNSTNHLKEHIGDRKRSYGLLNYNSENSKSYWISEYSTKQSELDQFKNQNNTTIEELDLLLSSITNRPTFLKNHLLKVPEIKLEKDSIADLSKRLIDLYMKEHGLKCKISVEPFEDSYK